MAKSRLINNKISESERVNALPAEAALLFTWMITHTDKYGRMKAHPLAIKNKVFPLRRITLVNIKRFLALMANSKKNGLGLIELYEVEGRQYLYLPGFDTEQKPKTKPKPGQEEDEGWRGKEGDSGIPAPPLYKPGMLTHEIPLTPSDDIPAPPSDDIPEPEVDKKLGKAYTIYEENIGQLTPMIADEIELLCKTHGPRWFEDACKEAAKHNVRNIKYITKILERWEKEGPGGKKPIKITGRDKPIDGLKVTE